MNLRLLPVWITGLALAACHSDDQGAMVGTLERDRVELKVESSEPISRIHVADGQAVQAGDAILDQDPARYRDRLELQTALRDQARARLAELRRGPRSEEIGAARARLQASEALAVNARAQLERQQEIFERGLGDAAAVDQATAQWRNAAASEQAERENLERLLNGTTVEELQQAEAALQAAEAAVKSAALDLERLSLRAPLAGRVDRVLFEIGERPQAGATVAVVLDAGRVYARIYVPEPLRAWVQPGATLEVRVDGLPDPLEGEVRWVSSDASFTPYFALTEHDRSQLSYLAEVDVEGAAGLPSGVPLEARLPDDGAP